MYVFYVLIALNTLLNHLFRRRFVFHHVPEGGPHHPRGLQHRGDRSELRQTSTVSKSALEKLFVKIWVKGWLIM
jgi:hypothetical protein